MTKKNSLKKQKTTDQNPTVALSVDRTLQLKKRLFWILSILAFLLYLPTINYGFVLDDIAVIENNRFVQDGIGGIGDLFTTFYWKGFWDSNSGLYRPLSLILFAIEHEIAPNSASVHHFFNVLFYALSIGMLFKVLSKLLSNYSIWIATAITTLFLLHPSHTEVVANIKSRDEILSFLFFLLTFNRLIEGKYTNLKDGFITGIFFLACLLSKEAGIMYIPIFGAYFFLVKKISFLQSIKQLLPLIFVGVAWFALHQTIIHADPIPPITYTYNDNSLVACENGSQVATGIGILGRYLSETVLPLNLSYDYSYNQLPCLTFGSIEVLLALLSVSLLLGLAVYTRKKHPLITFGIVFFFISIALVTNVFSLIGTTYANRLIYAPSLGLIIAGTLGITILIQRFNSSSTPSIAIFGCFALYFSIKTLQRTPAWESNASLFTADVQNSPNSARVHFNYGTLLMNTEGLDTLSAEAQLNRAVSSYNRALEIDKKDVGSLKNLGVVLFRLKKYEQSLLATKKAIELSPTDSLLFINLGDTYFSNNQFPEAISSYETIIHLKDNTAATYKRLAVSYFNLKKYPEAIRWFKVGIKRFPEDIEMLTNLGNAYGASGQVELANQTFLKAYELDGSNMNCLRMLIMTYQEMNNQERVNYYSQFLK